MIDYLLGILGIVVSVALFLVGYRQTIGAKKERVASANLELERILVRRVVLENYSPRKSDIAKLVSGKARDYRVSPGELLSEEQLLNTMYTRIMEGDLIPAQQRDELLDRITSAMEASRSSEPQEELISEMLSLGRRSRSTRWAALSLATLASASGALISAIPEFHSLNLDVRELLPVLAGTAGASFAVISLFYSVVRLRAAQDEMPSKADERLSQLAIEARVSGALARRGFDPVRHQSEFDFVVRARGKTLAIEVKNWTHTIPSVVLSVLTSRMKAAASQVAADEVIVVLPSARSHLLPKELNGVKLLSVQDFQRYIDRAWAEPA